MAQRAVLLWRLSRPVAFVSPGILPAASLCALRPEVVAQEGIEPGSCIGHQSISDARICCRHHVSGCRGRHRQTNLGPHQCRLPSRWRTEDVGGVPAPHSLPPADTHIYNPLNDQRSRPGVSCAHAIGTGVRSYSSAAVASAAPPHSRLRLRRPAAPAAGDVQGSTCTEVEARTGLQPYPNANLEPWRLCRL